MILTNIFEKQQLKLEKFYTRGEVGKKLIINWQFSLEKNLFQFDIAKKKFVHNILNSFNANVILFNKLSKKLNYSIRKDN